MTQDQEQMGKSRPMAAPLEGLPLPDLGNQPDYERGFWEGTQARELRIQRCSSCQKFRHPPSPMCPYCHSLSYDWAKTSGHGVVYSFLIVRQPAHPALREKEQTPYNICLIELEEQEGLRIISNVLDIAPEDIHIDMPVVVTFMPAADDPDVVLSLFVPERPDSRSV